MCNLKHVGKICLPNNACNINYLNLDHAATAQSQATCTGLDQLSQNINPSLLSNCAKDDDCTRVTCQPAGILRNYVSSAILTLTDPCSTSPPGVRLQLQATSGSALVDETVTSPTTIRRTVGFVTATITVFVNSSASAVGISVNRMSWLITSIMITLLVLKAIHIN